jgi:hypothetical protein
VPSNAPTGTKVLGKDGLFIPLLLTSGDNFFWLTFPNETRAL